MMPTPASVTDESANLPNIQKSECNYVMLSFVPHSWENGQ